MELEELWKARKGDERKGLLAEMVQAETTGEAGLDQRPTANGKTLRVLAGDWPGARTFEERPKSQKIPARYSKKRHIKWLTPFPCSLGYAIAQTLMGENQTGRQVKKRGNH